MRKGLKIAGRVCLGVVLAVLLSGVLFYFPPVQRFVADRVVEAVFFGTEMHMEAEEIRLSFPLNLTLRRVSVTGSARDTLLYVGHAAASVRPLPLLDGEVSIGAFRLEDVRLNTREWTEGFEVSGVADSLTTAGDHRIHLTREEIQLGELLLSGAAVNVRIDSLAPPDTTAPPFRWKLHLDDIRLQRIALALQMPSDSLQVAAAFENMTLTAGMADFDTECYSAALFLLTGASIDYDTGLPPPVRQGFDPSHIALSDLHVRLDSLFYQGREIHALLRSFSAGEQSGLSVRMEGSVHADSAMLSVPRWSLQTPYSTVLAQVEFPWSALADTPQGMFRSQLEASLDRRDVLTALGRQAREIERYYPDTVLTVSGLLEGNPDRMHLRHLQGELPGIFRVEADGVARKVTDGALRSGELHLTAQTGTSGLLQRLTLPPVAERFRIPEDMRLNLEATLTGGDYQCAMLLSGPQGRVRLSGHCDTRRNEYEAILDVDSLAPVRFMPRDSIILLTASIRAGGRGTDPFHDSTRLQVSGTLTELQIPGASFHGLSVEGLLREHRLHVSLVSEYPHARGTVTLDGALHRDRTTATLIAGVDSLDMYAMKWTGMPLAHSFQLFSEIKTDWEKRHLLDVTLGNWEMTMGTQQVSPKTLTLHASGDGDSMRCSLHAGDLGLTVTGSADLETTVRKLVGISARFAEQLKKDSAVRLQELRPLLPDVSLRMTAGHDNPVYSYLQENDLFFDRFALDASTSPDSGLQMSARLFSLIKDTTKIDTLRMNVWQDTAGIRHTGEIVKLKFRHQEPFTAGWNGLVQDDGASLEAHYRNGRGETGLRLGLRAKKQPEGWLFDVQPDAVIAFLPFAVNPDNHVLLKNTGDFSANLRLDGENDAYLWLHSEEEEKEEKEEEEEEEMKELMLEISRIDLDLISKGFGWASPVRGMADVSLRYVPVGRSYLIAAGAGVDDLIYRNGRVGELLLSGVYLPAVRGEHRIDLHFFHDEREIVALSASGFSKENGRLDGTFEINRLPLKMLDPFLDGLTQLSGTLQGRMTVAGTGKEPLLNGYLQADTAVARIAVAGTQLRFDGRKVEIRDSRAQFDKYGIYAVGDNPFVIDGVVDFQNPARAEVDLTLTASNMQLMNAPKTNESIVYGKLSAGLNATLKGPIGAPEMRGWLHLPGATNLTYILKESPLTAQDRMADLVTFSSFRDTLPRRARRSFTGVPREWVSAAGPDVLLNIRLDPSVKLRVDLDNTSSSRVELEGGGDLSFRYTRQGDLMLTGRYTLSGGLVKYNMPVIANKTLKIKENSYIEWTGDPFDPYLSLKATERIRSSVGAGGQAPHPVNFDAGIEVKQRLANLSLQFTLEALDDASVQNQLIAMGPEERNKQAVSLLLTGMYLADDGSGKSKLDMGMALNSFLQSEINNITGSLLKNIDFDFTMDRYDGTKPGSGRRTDYAFRFSKRFYNERLNVILGGRVSTGDATKQNSTFINDASLEYRLDAGGSHYARLFYNRSYESLLEGEIAKYGTGIVFRKKMRRLDDLFLFWKKQKTILEGEEKKGKK
ncbi:MAG: translocation/assembly module TamB domain-containing protein [Tannerella sp.]|jgi:hypothetical protein|nr:translocation/assembly module TamB domain-containing protein [Tannerella sp.]